MRWHHPSPGKRLCFIPTFPQHTPVEGFVNSGLIAGQIHVDDTLFYEIEGRPQYLSLRAFGSLVKHALPVKLSGEGVPMTVLAARYRFPMPEEHYFAGGDMLQKSGLRLCQQFGGTGYNDRLRLLGDNGSRMYYIHAVEE